VEKIRSKLHQASNLCLPVRLLLRYQDISIIFLVRFQVLTAACMKITVFRGVAPCSLVEVYRRFRGSCCLHRQGSLHHRADGAGGKNLWSVGKRLPDDTAQHPRRQLFALIFLPSCQHWHRQQKFYFHFRVFNLVSQADKKCMKFNKTNYGFLVLSVPLFDAFPFFTIHGLLSVSFDIINLWNWNSDFKQHMKLFPWFSQYYK
jgi:hypothetical protein